MRPQKRMRAGTINCFLFFFGLSVVFEISMDYKVLKEEWGVLYTIGCCTIPVCKTSNLVIPYRLGNLPRKLLGFEYN